MTYQANQSEDVSLKTAACTHPADGLPFDALEQIIDEYVADYEMVGEAEDGRYACHQPTDGERILIKDAILGLLAHDAWDAEWGRLIQQRAKEVAAFPPQAKAEPAGVSDLETFNKWVDEVARTGLFSDTSPEPRINVALFAWEAAARAILSAAPSTGVTWATLAKALEHIEPEAYSGVDRIDVGVGVTRDAALRWGRADDEDQPLYTVAQFREAFDEATPSQSLRIAGAAGPLGDEVECPECKGSGLLDTSGFGDLDACDECHGKGTVGPLGDEGVIGDGVTACGSYECKAGQRDGVLCAEGECRDAADVAIPDGGNE
jgi:hypothetical protein